MARRPVLMVTGGSRGIGASMVELASQRGYDICLTYSRNQEAAEATSRKCEAHGARVLALQMDLAFEDQIVEAWQRAIGEFGQVDGLVNNAGILRQQMRLANFSSERLREIFNVNVIGTMLCCKAAVRHMSTEEGGAGGVIVSLSSIAARLGSPDEYIDYAASKAAIDTLTVGLAKEVAQQGIRVNSVRPGTIDTEIHASGGEPNRIQRIAQRVPLGRGGQPEEIAGLVLWLCSNEASYVTGSVFEVGGGL